MEVADIILQTFLVNHPYHMKQMCYINKVNFGKCKDRGFLNQLIKTWLFPHLSYLEIQNCYSHLTFNDIVEYALFFSPIPESLNNYSPLSLYSQACERSEEINCKVFIEHIYNNYLSYDDSEHFIIVSALIAYKHYHLESLYNMFEKFIVQHSTRQQHQLTVEYIRKKLSLFIACILGNGDLINKSWDMLKFMDNGGSFLSYEGASEIIDIIENAYVGLPPLCYAQIIGNWLSLEWGGNYRCLDVYIASLKLKSKVITDHNPKLSSISTFAGNLASVMTDEEIEMVVSEFNVSDKTYRPEEKFNPYLPPYLSGCWTNRSLYTRDSLFIYRPDLLSEEELLNYPKSSYIESDNYELYLTYRNNVPNRLNQRINNNWLGVKGYNSQFSELAKHHNILPENM